MIIFCRQFRFLGLADDTLINKGVCSWAGVLQFILERKWILKPDDKDMIVMLHEIGYEVKGQKSKSKCLGGGRRSFANGYG